MKNECHPEWLDDYLDGALNPAETAMVELHLRECAVCQERLQDLQIVTDLFAAAIPAPPPDLATRILNGLPTAVSRPSAALAEYAHVGVWTAVGTALVGLVFLSRAWPALLHFSRVLHHLAGIFWVIGLGHMGSLPEVLRLVGILAVIGLLGGLAAHATRVLDGQNGVSP